MAYKISYGSARDVSNPKSRFRLWLSAVAAIVFGLAILVRLVFPEETKLVTEALFPLTSASSREALEVFSQNINAGESFGDAVTAFCREIIYDANIS